MVIVDFPNGKKCSYDGYLVEILSSFNKAVRDYDTSVVILNDGKSGKGKTTLSIQEGYYLNHKDINIYFNPEDFLKGMAKAKAESVHIFDEAMFISSRSAMSEVNRMVIQAMSMIRSKRIYVIFNVNSIFDLDKNLVLSRADCLFHVYSDGLLDRGKFCAFFKASGDKIDRLKLLYLHGKKFYDYGRPKANFFGSFPKTFLINENKYEADKQIAINEFLTQTDSQRSTKAVKVTKRLIEYLRLKKKMKVREIAEISELTPKTIYNYLS